METTKIDTIEDFKSFFSTTFESKKSVFQVMQETENWTRKSTESHRDYANRISQELYDLTSVVKAKWKEAKKQEKSSFDKEMEADDVFKLIGGMVVLRDVAKDPSMFNHVITRIDSATDASGIASVVMAYADRKQTIDPVLPDLPTVNHAENKPRETDTVCWHWKKYGRCGFRNQCPGSHPAEFEKIENDQDQRGRKTNKSGWAGEENGTDKNVTQVPSQNGPLILPPIRPTILLAILLRKNSSNKSRLSMLFPAGFSTINVDRELSHGHLLGHLPSTGHFYMTVHHNHFWPTFTATQTIFTRPTFTATPTTTTWPTFTATPSHSL